MRDTLARLGRWILGVFVWLWEGLTRFLLWVWNTGVVGSFLAGFFVVLPIVITIGIMGWVGGLLQEWLGQESFVGLALTGLGLQFAADPLAYVVGWAIVLAAIWLLGVYVKSAGRTKVEKTFRSAVEQIPVVNVLYKPVVQVIDMFKGGDQDEMAGMGVVYCTFGAQHGAGFLGLLVSPQVYRFAGQECHTVYVPTSPVPMSGAVVFVPVRAVQRVDMQVDDLMQIYFSIGVMSSKVIPKQYVVSETPEGSAGGPETPSLESGPSEQEG